MTKFRGCIDIHNGQVKQIVGSSLNEEELQQLKTNHVSSHGAGYFAKLYRDHHMEGVHVIKLGPNCDAQAKSALKEWPNHLQIGGGINPSNAMDWINAGACKVIVTSYIFNDKTGNLCYDRLDQLVAAVGGKHRLVIDLSCKKVEEEKWVVAMNKWTTLTKFVLNRNSLHELAHYCSEFLIHAAHVEGKCNGIDDRLVENLAVWSPIPVTYAGGVSCIEDLTLIDTLSNGKVDATIGSALDIFGGTGITFSQCIEWNNNH